MMSPEPHWSGNEILQTGTADCKEPAIIAAGDALHILWTQDKTLYHIFGVDERWSAPQKIGVGGQAALARTPDGTIQCLFAAEMFGNIEIYATSWDGARWALPQVVSRTSGISMYPALAVGPDGSLYAAWADTTPGYATIYYGHHETGGWTSTPVPNGIGNRPTIAVGRAGEVYLAWQSRLVTTRRFDVFCAILSDEKWRLPENVSDAAQHHAIGPRLMVTATGDCHLVWQEDRGEVFGIRHAHHHPNGWSLPDDVSQSDADCRAPYLAAIRQGNLQVVWSEGPALQHRVRPPGVDAAWWRVETGSTACAGLSDLRSAIDASGALHVVWCGYDASDNRRLNHIRREPIFKQTTFMPIVTG